MCIRDRNILTGHVMCKLDAQTAEQMSELVAPEVPQHEREALAAAMADIKNQQLPLRYPSARCSSEPGPSGLRNTMLQKVAHSG
eukprot:2821195-Karenia_brevis.AAC.1